MPAEEWNFISNNGKGNRDLNERLKVYDEHAVELSINAISDCTKNIIKPSEITQLSGR